VFCSVMLEVTVMTANNGTFAHTHQHQALCYMHWTAFSQWMAATLQWTLKKYILTHQSLASSTVPSLWQQARSTEYKCIAVQLSYKTNEMISSQKTKSVVLAALTADRLTLLCKTREIQHQALRRHLTCSTQLRFHYCQKIYNSNTNA